ncbi:MAG: phosphopantothenoylcysteine decarboxylase [Candidatus Omnitrophota bacterium]
MSLRNKRILITAGPTWVPLDAVRVISNTATGETGILLAGKLQKLGAKVTLLLGPARVCCLDTRIELKRFTFFDELKRAITGELSSRKYDIAIQTAAVADYKLRLAFKEKIGSGIKRLRLELVPTPKIINMIKDIDHDIYLVGFKFEPKATKRILIAEAKSLMKRAKVDLTIANTVYKNRYQAYLIGKDKIEGPLNNKTQLAGKLVRTLTDVFEQQLLK